VFSTIFSGSNDLIVIVIAVVVLFGGTQLPKLARNAGQAMKEFRKGHTDEPSDSGTPSAAGQVAPTQSVVPVVPVVPMAPVQAPALAQGQPSQVAAPAVPGEERITLTRAQLDAILADNEARAIATNSDGTDAQS
jgi:sec-independent protein translocase protein TatA